MYKSVVSALPKGLVIVAAPFLWTQTKRELCQEFCRSIHRDALGNEVATWLEFDLNGQQWDDVKWVQRRMSGFSQQIRADKTRGVSVFTVCQPTQFFPYECVPSLTKLRELAISQESTIVILTHEKQRFARVEARQNPLISIRGGLKVEPIADGAGLLVQSNPYTFSLFLKPREQPPMIFENVCSVTPI
jgi:hypothetical protein